MSTAQNLLVGYGVVVLAYGFVLGIPLAAVRTKQPAASRHLVNAHLSGLIQGPIHLGLAFAIGAVGFDSWLAVAAVGLVIAGSVAETVGGTLNWLQGTGDQFAEKSVGFRINGLTGLLAVPGVIIITGAVVGGL